MIYPNRPAIRKHGTIKCGVVESTPIVFNGRLYRFEYNRASGGEGGSAKNVSNTDEFSTFHFIDLENGKRHTPFAENHHLGCAYTDGGVMYAVGLKDKWGSDTLHFFRSTDLDNWELYSELKLDGWSMFNTGICKMNGVYTLLMEINGPVEEAGTNPFTFRFAQSKDMTNWELTPSDCVFQKDRYAGGPAIYTVGDGYYYVFYLEAYPGPGYANCIARSKDLKEWEYSRLNPVLMYDDKEDKKIASPFIIPEHQELIRGALDINNSDLEMCEFNGRTVMYYSWGNQLGTEFLAEASYEGPMDEFLKSWFE